MATRDRSYTIKEDEMKKGDFDVIKYLVIAFILFVACTGVTTIAKTSTTISNQSDSVPSASSDEEDLSRREEKSVQFIKKLNAYYNDSTEYTWKIIPDSALCEEIIRYYSKPNPLDGYPGECQAITIYDLFCNNDSLFKAIDCHMKKKNVHSMLQDSIWIRISYDIWGNMQMNEFWDDKEKMKDFKFLLENGYFIDDYDPYIR